MREVGLRPEQKWRLSILTGFALVVGSLVVIPEIEIDLPFSPDPLIDEVERMLTAR